MTDTLTKRQRSYNMSRIRSKNTKPERIVFEYLQSKGFKYELHFDTYGKPDIAFPEKKIAIFVDGEFWHGKNFALWKDKLSPFWLKKISINIQRDKRNRLILKKEGWKILRIWHKKLLKSPEKIFLKLSRFIEENSS